MPYGKDGRYPPEEGKIYDRAGYEELIKIISEPAKVTTLNVIFMVCFLYAALLTTIWVFKDFDKSWWTPVFFAGLAFFDRYYKCSSEYKIKLRNHMEKVKQAINEESFQSKNTVNLTLSDGSSITAPINIGSQIVNSYKEVKDSGVSNELKEKLSQLSREVAEASKNLDKVAQIQLADKLGSLNKVIAEGEAGRQWWHVNANSLKEVAKVIGQVGLPIIKTVEELIKLFTLN
jgi:DNA-binding transcriptional MerR regulator